ncbi:bifunctional alpha/beta hydrolase/class I SAM-dependent methyltransferase [Chitinivorax sp. B]|uniref:bifunctional alpha/beta hydrolase/class I SAM-dependent methyltransferase n=1 Tax=Chitinivorax sp. B TaxID=2502235 RepID=UPI0010F55AC3|nr:bifunctional alpha/beta hydrolase/class I SAM-dependent methyltransferase [Chitinivorax sp. B]
MRTPIEHRFTSFDGVALFYRHWPATQPGPEQKAVALFHRGHEHSGRMQDVVDKLDLPDFDLFAWDARGHGLSPGDRGYAEHFGVLVKDIDSFVQHINQQHGVPTKQIAIMAQSVGAVLATTWVHDFAPPVRCLVLATPALKVKLYVPLAIPALRFLMLFKKKAFVQSYVKPKLLTHDPVKIESYQQDKLITRAIAVNILVSLFDTANRLIRDAAAVHPPTLMLTSGNDWVVHQQPQWALFDGLASKIKEKHLFPGFFHDTLNEKDNHLPIGKAREFILRAFSQPQSSPSLLNAHREGYTYQEYQALTQPLSMFSPKRWNFALTRLGLKIGAWFSDGIRLGVQTGFDSGSTLDYVYRNQPSGFTPFGKLVDWFYINSIGWRGIRLRKQHLEQLLAQTMAKVAASGQAVHLVDIAAGHGRYILDALAAFKQPFTAVLRDYSPINVDAGQKLITERGLSDKVHFIQGDAFDQASLANLSPKPTVAVVSGLYELFPDNDMIQRSLAGLAQAIPAGGYLVYTNQPWHPQLEMIARALTSHRDNQPWIMRRRTQLEMDQLVEAAGFEKQDQLIDEWGIFSVSVARRKGA